jgi:hypothetical protein
MGAPAGLGTPWCGCGAGRVTAARPRAWPTEENPTPDELKPEPRADFAADFRDGEAMAREWIAGGGDLPDLLHIVRDMPRRDELGGLEAGFLSTIDAAIRGDRLDAAIQDGWCRIVADDHCRVSACPRWDYILTVAGESSNSRWRRDRNGWATETMRGGEARSFRET